MAYSDDFKWRIVSLIHIYGVDASFLSFIFGPKVRTIRRWYQLFRDTGVVQTTLSPNRTSRWPDVVLEEVKTYIHEHPTFYIKELKDFLSKKFPTLKNNSLSTICRALNFDMNMSCWMMSEMVIY